jgi:hypothetical protein
MAGFQLPASHVAKGPQSYNHNEQNVTTGVTLEANAFPVNPLQAST